MTDLPELMNLIDDTPDVVMFLRAQMEANAKASDGADWSDTERVESTDQVTTHKDPRKAPCNLSAMEAADREIACLAHWAEVFGLPFKGRVWRVKGVPWGLVGADLKPVYSLPEAFRVFAEVCDWQGDPTMLDELRKVRTENRKKWPELDALLLEIERNRPVVVVEEPSLF